MWPEALWTPPPPHPCRVFLYITCSAIIRVNVYVLQCCFKLTLSNLIHHMLPLLTLTCLRFVLLWLIPFPLQLWWRRHAPIRLFTFLYTWMTTDKSWDRNTGCTFYFTVKKEKSWCGHNIIGCFMSIVYCLNDYNQFKTESFSLLDMNRTSESFICKRFCFSFLPLTACSFLFVSLASFNLSWPPEEGIAASARTKHPLPLPAFLAVWTFYSPPLHLPWLNMALMWTRMVFLTTWGWLKAGQVRNRAQFKSAIMS